MSIHRGRKKIANWWKALVEASKPCGGSEVLFARDCRFTGDERSKILAHSLRSLLESPLLSVSQDGIVMNDLAALAVLTAMGKVARTEQTCRDGARVDRIFVYTE